MKCDTVHVYVHVTEAGPFRTEEGFKGGCDGSHDPLFNLEQMSQAKDRDDMAQEVRAVIWQSEGCRFDTSLGVSKCP